MHHLDQDLSDLVATGKAQGYLTYDQVNEYLPDEAVNPDKLDSLLVALEEMGIELVEEPPQPVSEADEADAAAARSAKAAEEEPELDDAPAINLDEPAKWSDDPVRMYLTQMAVIPLLTREQEISLAKKIEITRKRFRRTVLSCNLAMQNTIETLCKVHEGVLPFDRTIKVSLTECLTKEQIMARMPHNLRTLHHLLEQNRRDFRTASNKRLPRAERLVARRRFLSQRTKALTLVEELSLRTRRVQPMVRELEKISARMEDLKIELAELADNSAAKDERANLRKEFRDLLMLVLESPSALRRRCELMRAQYEEYERAKREQIGRAHV